MKDGEAPTLTSLITTLEVENDIIESTSFEMLYFGIGVGIGATLLLIGSCVLLKKSKLCRGDNPNKTKQEISNQIAMNAYAAHKTKLRVSTASQASSINMNSCDFDANFCDMAIAMSVDLPQDYDFEVIKETKNDHLKLSRRKSTDDGLWDRPRQRHTTSTTDQGEAFDTKVMDLSE